jgi:hypothetical protein
MSSIHVAHFWSMSIVGKWDVPFIERSVRIRTSVSEQAPNGQFYVYSCHMQPLTQLLSDFTDRLGRFLHLMV